MASSNRILLLTRVTLTFLRASGQNAKYDTYPRPATAAVGGIKLIQSRTINKKSKENDTHVLLCVTTNENNKIQRLSKLSVIYDENTFDRKYDLNGLIISTNKQIHTLK